MMDLLRLTLKPGLREGQALPRLLFFDELASLNATSWLGFERVLLVHNRWAGWERANGIFPSRSLAGCCSC